tara:strand:+ start:20 stop:679 length:660 start_codon:yes stop_codon:yes gene_type:complete
MGANATTFVPAYVAGEVLTAADLGVTNSGIPVFATTVTRDAAFGGTGEKVLAEGQFAYIEATDQTMYYSGSSWLALGGKLGQVQSTFKADAFSTTSTSFVDVTGLTVDITPSAATSKVLIMAYIANSGSTTNDYFMNLNRGATAICQTTSGSTISTARGFVASAMTLYTTVVFLDSPATTSATTYKIQGKVGSDTMYVNRRGADTLGSTSTITVMEILA